MSKTKDSIYEITEREINELDIKIKPISRGRFLDFIYKKNFEIHSINNDFLRLVTWLEGLIREPARTKFTAGRLRDFARDVEVAVSSKRRYDRFCEYEYTPMEEDMGFEKSQDLKKRLKFGDVVLNHYAGPNNPNKAGVFVKLRGRDIECTDMKGNFWYPFLDSNSRLEIIGTILN